MLEAAGYFLIRTILSASRKGRADISRPMSNNIRDRLQNPSDSSSPTLSFFFGVAHAHSSALFVAMAKMRSWRLEVLGARLSYENYRNDGAVFKNIRMRHSGFLNAFTERKTWQRATKGS